MLLSKKSDSATKSYFPSSIVFNINIKNPDQATSKATNEKTLKLPNTTRLLFLTVLNNITGFLKFRLKNS